MTNLDKGFCRGWCCAVAVSIRNYGIGTEVVELWRCNKYTMAQMKAAGVDQFDIDTLKQHWKELNR